jgi:hypothetical protein
MTGYNKDEVAQYVLTYLNKNKTYKIIHDNASEYDGKERMIVTEVC